MLLKLNPIQRVKLTKKALSLKASSKIKLEAKQASLGREFQYLGLPNRFLLQL